MSKSKISKILFEANISFVVVFASLLSGVSTSAQSVQSREVKIALQKQITVNAGAKSDKSTLLTILKGFSQQTGITIESEKYLLDREVSVFAKNISAKEALDALIELNEWEYYETSAHQIRIRRLSHHEPKNLSEIPKALLSSMPIDVKRFIGIGISSEEISFPTDSPHQGSEARTFKRFPIRAVSLNNEYRLTGMLQKSEERIVKLLETSSFSLGKYLYNDWSADLKEEVYARLFLELLKSESAGDQFVLYSANPYPYIIDLSQANLSVDGNSISISCRIPPPPENPDAIHKVGFGGQVKDLTRKDPP